MKQLKKDETETTKPEFYGIWFLFEHLLEPKARPSTLHDEAAKKRKEAGDNEGSPF